MISRIALWAYAERCFTVIENIPTPPPLPICMGSRLRPAPSWSTIHAFMDLGTRARHGRVTYGRLRVHYARSLIVEITPQTKCVTFAMTTLNNGIVKIKSK
ncbi:hypothetical protein PoB_002848200 [Plakobranchus ocellatus]|uniref:Uncharacterized protein n=1 Tax=Plakobranchus ocellatus TaxID=259542 RepID=A0AAV4A549_9GAST|nr:hypothetical protein PoB_002848200 [Plakobranchus ocellatus]